MDCPQVNGPLSVAEFMQEVLLNPIAVSFLDTTKARRGLKLTPLWLTLTLDRDITLVQARLGRREISSPRLPSRKSSERLALAQEREREKRAMERAGEERKNERAQ